MNKTTTPKKQWLWFLGLYAASVIAVAGVVSVLHLFLHM